MIIPLDRHKTIEHEVSKAHIPPAVAIRGCNTFRENLRQNYESVKDFIMLNQVVAEKTLTKNVHMRYIRVSDGKIGKNEL